MNLERLEARLQELPLYTYGIYSTDELMFTERVRYICKAECPRYGKSWACPPAVGTVEECSAKCLSYPKFLMISTITEISDIANIEEGLATRPAHEEITRQVRDMLLEETDDVYVLSTESCGICETCAWPDGPCRHPDKMFPCVESHGILVTEMAERNGIDFLAGSNLVTWFSILFFR